MEIVIGVSQAKPDGGNHTHTKTLQVRDSGTQGLRSRLKVSNRSTCHHLKRGLYNVGFGATRDRRVTARSCPVLPCYSYVITPPPSEAAAVSLRQERVEIGVRVGDNFRDAFCGEDWGCCGWSGTMLRESEIILVIAYVGVR